MPETKVILPPADLHALALFRKSLEPYLDDPGAKGCQARMLTHTCRVINEAFHAERIRGSQPTDIMDGIIAVVGNILGPSSQNFTLPDTSSMQMFDYFMGRVDEEVRAKLLARETKTIESPAAGQA